MTIKYSLEKCKILIKSRSPHQTAFQVISEVAKTHPKRQQVPQKHSLKQHDFLKVLCAARRGDVPCSGRGECGRGRRHFPSPGSGWTLTPTCRSKGSSSGSSGAQNHLGGWLRGLPATANSLGPGRGAGPSLLLGVWSDSRPLARTTLCGSCACPSSEIKAASLSLTSTTLRSSPRPPRRSALLAPRSVSTVIPSLVWDVTWKAEQEVCTHCSRKNSTRKRERRPRAPKGHGPW